MPYDEQRKRKREQHSDRPLLQTKMLGWQSSESEKHVCQARFFVFNSSKTSSCAALDAQTTLCIIYIYWLPEWASACFCLRWTYCGQETSCEFFFAFFYLFYVFSTVIHRAFILSLWLSQLICFWSFRVMFWGNSHSITSWNYRNILLLRSKFYGRFLFQHKYGIVFFRFAQINGKFLLQWQLRLFSYADDKFEFFLNTIIWMMVFFFCLDNNLFIYLFKNKRINLLKKNCLAKNRSVYQSE